MDAYTFTTYSVAEITNMDFSGSSDAYGYEITASWDDYQNLAAGSRSSEKKYSEEGILLIYQESLRWEEKSGGYELVIENTDQQNIPSFPLSLLGLCSILGIAVIFLKKR